MEEQKSEKKKRLLQSKKTLELDLKTKMKSVEKRLQRKQTLAEELVLQTRTSIPSPVKPVMRNPRKPMSSQNSEIFNSYQSGSRMVKSIMKPSVQADKVPTTGGDDLSAVNQGESQTDAISTRDKRGSMPLASYIQPINKRNRPVTAISDYNHKLYERASKLWDREQEHNIESLRLSIENKMSVAEQKKKERVAMISHNIRVDNYKKEQL